MTLRLYDRNKPVYLESVPVTYIGLFDTDYTMMHLITNCINITTGKVSKIESKACWYVYILISTANVAM